MSKSQDTRSFVLRVDAAAMEALEAWADDEFRSINGQLQWILADALRRSGRLPGRRRARSGRGVAPEEVAPVEAAPEGAAPEGAASDGSVSARAGAEGAGANSAAPEGTASVEAALEKPAPAGTGTENAVPEGTCPAADKAKSEAKNETQRSNR
ncbi:hypothetical protein B5F90_08650 [Alistipes sp. An31A]|uniref:hypothetical protein n=1 Tax=unclassified Alistipes TaxID=2608932 RepID=UPI000B3818E5|nr:MULTISPECIES: hypothetical protein [unclassified Alistipes]OUO19719.1 hypothetical protein B5F90_08650 [Alistipes sp. An31A]